MTISSSRRFLLVAAAAVAVLGVLPVAANGTATSRRPLPPELAAQVADFAATTGLDLATAERYFALTRAAGAVEDRARARYADTFAGLWRSPADGGLLHLAFTRDAQRSARAAAAEFPRRDLVRAVTFGRSLRELDTLAARITADLPALRADGLAVDTVAVDVPGNGIRLAVAGSLDVARPALQRRYAGAPIRVEAARGRRPLVTACTRASCPQSLIGGLKFTGAGFACTSGFAATKNARRVAITAGHCFPSGTPVSNGGIVIGPVTSRVWPGAGDAELVQVDPELPLLHATSNAVLWKEPGQYVTVLGVAGRTVTETVGAPICRTGISTEDRCGTVTARNVTVHYTTGETTTGMTLTTACAIPGDSGGPVMSFNDAFGITSGADPCGVPGAEMVYTPAGRAETLLGARILTS